jgi:hypothetical protein
MIGVRGVTGGMITMEILKILVEITAGRDTIILGQGVWTTVMAMMTMSAVIGAMDKAAGTLKAAGMSTLIAAWKRRGTAGVVDVGIVQEGDVASHKARRLMGIEGLYCVCSLPSFLFNSILTKSVFIGIYLRLFQQQRRRAERKQFLLSWNLTATTLSLRIVLLREILLVHWLGMLQALPKKRLPLTMSIPKVNFSMTISFYSLHFS